MVKIKIKKLSKDAIIPTKAHAEDAAYDLYTSADVTLSYGKRVIAPTDIAIELPIGYAASVRPRSGFSAKGIEGADGVRYNADVCIGLIDCNYRNGIGIIVKSNDNHAFVIPKGTRLAQLLIEKTEETEFEEVEELSDTERGTSGFGSSGTK